MTKDGHRNGSFFGAWKGGPIAFSIRNIIFYRRFFFSRSKTIGSVCRRASRHNRKIMLATPSDLATTSAKEARIPSYEDTQPLRTNALCIWPWSDHFTPLSPLFSSALHPTSFDALQTDSPFFSLEPVKPGGLGAQTSPLSPPPQFKSKRVRSEKKKRKNPIQLQIQMVCEMMLHDVKHKKSSSVSISEWITQFEAIHPKRRLYDIVGILRGLGILVKSSEPKGLFITRFGILFIESYFNEPTNFISRDIVHVVDTSSLMRCTGAVWRYLVEHDEKRDTLRTSSKKRRRNEDSFVLKRAMDKQKLEQTITISTLAQLFSSGSQKGTARRIYDIINVCKGLKLINVTKKDRAVNLSSKGKWLASLMGEQKNKKFKK